MEKAFNIESNLLQQINAEQAFHYRIVPVANRNGHLNLVTDTEITDSLNAELSLVLNKSIILEQIDSESLNKFLTSNYRQNKKTKNQQLHYTKDFLEKILLNAKEIGSSDIHFEPYEELCRIRFRIDGKLIEQYNIPRTEYPVIVNKIKIRSGLDISEKRLPQDGRITIKTTDNEFDVRVSTLPTLFGEKIVLRILNRDTQSISLESLGFNNDELLIYKEGIKRPNGIVLISGPTGSGKTTTLYATLKVLNKPYNNILTIEDPIEYTLEGINQVQLKESIGLDFSGALRTFLRQDPDIIMVGEIRDNKTANMAIRASLTGHLVLSTIHTNSAWATISRLVDMGIPPFLIASTLNMSVAQRLVRLLCPSCKKKVKVDKEYFPKNFTIPHNLSHHYIATGCNNCYHTGYKGRKAIYEIIPISTDFENKIKNNELDISGFLNENQIATLQDNAVKLIIEGNTSIEEVYSMLTT